MPFTLSNTGNKLSDAKENRCDEWYTQYQDVKDELDHYVEHFKDKTIGCLFDTYSDDNKTCSNFYKYFTDNFEAFGLRELIASHYEPCSEKENYYRKVTRTEGADGQPCVEKKDCDLHGDGDFFSEQVQDLVSKCDIIVSNPPFSHVLNIVRKLLEKKKAFLLLCPHIFIKQKGIWQAFAEGRLRCGYTFGKTLNFIVPEWYGKAKGVSPVDGLYYYGSPVGWVTTLPVCRDAFDSGCMFADREREFDDTNKILCVNRWKDFPMDYKGMIAVPATGAKKINLNKYNIIGNEDMFNIKLKGKRLNQRLVIVSKEQ